MRPLSKKQQYWQDHVDRWRESGLSQAEYCRRHEVHLKQFYNNKNHLENRGKPKLEKPGQFFPIALTPDLTPTAQSSSIDIRVNDVIIQFTNSTDEMLLLKLVNCLRKAS